MKREKPTTKSLILDKKKKLILTEKSFLSQMGADGTIRIENKQYKYLPKGKYLVHFNLEQCRHKVGYVYALPRIIEHGYFSKTRNKQELPLLSFENIIFGKCLKVREKLKYLDLKSKDFKYSFSNIKTVAQLKRSILTRYSKSMPDLTKEQILKLGVSYTLLERV